MLSLLSSSAVALLVQPPPTVPAAVIQQATVRPAIVETSPAASLLLADIFDDIPQTANPNLARQVEIMKAKQQAAIDAEERLYAEAAAKEEAAAAARAAREEATRKRLAEQAAAREEAELARLEAAAAAAERKALGLSAAPTPGGAAAPGSARQAAIAKATIGGGVEQYVTDRGARAKPECLYCFGQ